jgi:hypothetical protein
MSLLSTLVGHYPQRFYLGVDIGYREQVAVIISLETFARGGDAWLRSPAITFASTRTGLRALQKYLDRFSLAPTEFFGLCEPTGGLLRCRHLSIFVGSRVRAPVDREFDDQSHARENLWQRLQNG